MDNLDWDNWDNWDNWAAVVPSSPIHRSPPFSPFTFSSFVNSFIIDYNCHRYQWAEDFVDLALQPWLLKRGFSLGRNLHQLPKKMLYWSFFMSKKKPNLVMNGPYPHHRNLEQDYSTFSWRTSFDDWDKLLNSWQIDGVFDESENGLLHRTEFAWFVYCYLDLELSEAAKAEDEIENIGETYQQPKNVPDIYLVEAGYFRGDRVM